VPHLWRRLLPISRSHESRDERSAGAPSDTGLAGVLILGAKDQALDWLEQGHRDHSTLNRFGSGLFGGNVSRHVTRANLEIGRRRLHKCGTRYASAASSALMTPIPPPVLRAVYSAGASARCCAGMSFVTVSAPAVTPQIALQPPLDRTGSPQRNRSSFSSILQ